MASARPPELIRWNGRYGFDGRPAEAAIPVGAGLALLLAGGFGLWAGAPVWPFLALAVGVLLVAGTGSWLYATRRGKFVAWARLLTRLGFVGDEQVADLGCGRGAVLVAVAQLLPDGAAVGIDRWTGDQSANRPDATRRNAALEGVADRVHVTTGDLRSLPFHDAAFDTVLSSLAIHNLRGRHARRQALGEAVRVLRPGGRLTIVDILHTKQYAADLARLGLVELSRRSLGWRFWFFGPLVRAQLVDGRKPEQRRMGRASSRSGTPRLTRHGRRTSG